MARYATFGGQPLIDPGSLAAKESRRGTPMEFWQRANSYTCPVGPQCGEAWLLLLRRDLDKLQANQWHSLQWVDGDQTLTIPNLIISKSYTQVLALPGEAKAARLVVALDKRRVMQMACVDRQYNVRIPAPSATSGTGLYYTDSLDVGSLWTWQTLLDDIWSTFPSNVRGTAPTLPYSPDGTPDGWRLIGVNSWDALHVVLRKIGCTTAFDPIQGTFSYDRLGTNQSGLATSLAAVANRKIYDYDPGAGYFLARAPEIVRVFFPRREQYHGIEEDTPDADNWELSPAVSKDYATGLSGAESGTVECLWDDLPALFDSAGSNTNSSALQDRADEIGANIAGKLDLSDDPYRTMFGGLVITITPGSQVSEVVWRDYGDDAGLVTEIIRRPVDEIADPGSDRSKPKVEPIAERLSTVDFARPSYPVYPRTDQLVQVDDGASAIGADLTANADGLFPGFVAKWADGAYTQLEDCWIRPSDLEGVSESAVASLKQKDRLIGRLYGVETSGGTTLPVYLARRGEPGEGGIAFLVQVAGAADDQGQASQEDTGGTPVCVWDAALFTPDQTSGEICGGISGTTSTNVWLGFVGADVASDPYFLPHTSKFHAFDSGLTFTPTDNAARPLWLAHKDQETFWFQAKQNWSRNQPTSADAVVCHPCDDGEGRNVDTSIERTIELPQSAERDPNVVQDDVIAARLTMDGVWVCVSDYLDDKIGTVKMWALDSADVPPGWAVMNGQDNSSANGGSGIKMTNRFVRAGPFAGRRGGNEQHTHEIDVDIGSHTQIQLAQAIQGISSIFNITVADHAIDDLKHEHAINLDTISNGWPAGYEGWTPDQAARLGCTLAPLENDGDCLGNPWGPISHDVGFDINPGAGGGAAGAVGLNHTVSTAEIFPAKHLPPYTDLIFIERIDNSQ